MPALLLILLALPVVELAVFIEIGGLIGLWPTLALALAAMAAGIFLLRRMGFATLTRAEASLARQESPLPDLLRGFTIMVAGVLLVIPGFVTDAIALALLVPAVRGALGRALWNALRNSDRVTVWAAGQVHDGATVVEGEYREIDVKAKRIE